MFGEILCDRCGFLEAESPGTLGNVLGVPSGARDQLARNGALEEGYRGIVELVDFLEGLVTRSLPGCDDRESNLTIVRCVAWKDLDAAHLRELAQYLFDV